MENLVKMSEKPFQIIAFLCLGLALLIAMRLIVEVVFPIKILPKVTTGIILNALVIGIMVIVAILSVIGEFVIRNFFKLQKNPAFIIKEIYKRPMEQKKKTSSTD